MNENKKQLYIIEQHYLAEQLAIQVNARIEEGYQLLGTPWAKGGDCTLVYQAMIYKPKPEARWLGIPVSQLGGEEFLRCARHLAITTRDWGELLEVEAEAQRRIKLGEYPRPAPTSTTPI